jgi:hypothetical protein
MQRKISLESNPIGDFLMVGYEKEKENHSYIRRFFLDSPREHDRYKNEKAEDLGK